MFGKNLKNCQAQGNWQSKLQIELKSKENFDSIPMHHTVCSTAVQKDLGLAGELVGTGGKASFEKTRISHCLKQNSFAKSVQEEEACII